MRVREWLATNDDRSRWHGLREHEFDSAVFKRNDRATDVFLSTPPFGSTQVPPLGRKPKRTKTKMGDKEDRDPVARLCTDIENVIQRRRIGPGDAQSLREAVEVLNADDVTNPLEFEWDTAVYQVAYDQAIETQEEDEKQHSDRALEDINVHHPVGSVWIVRSDFDSGDDWKDRPRAELEVHWVVQVVGRAYRKPDSSNIMVPVRYYENVGKATDRTRQKKVRTKYKLGEVTNNLSPADLQLAIQMNVPKAGGSFIKHHLMPAVEHTSERWYRNAVGDYDVGQGGRVEK